MAVRMLWGPVPSLCKQSHAWSPQLVSSPHKCQDKCAMCVELAASGHTCFCTASSALRPGPYIPAKCRCIKSHGRFSVVAHSHTLRCFPCLADTATVSCQSEVYVIEYTGKQATVAKLVPLKHICAGSGMMLLAADDLIRFCSMLDCKQRWSKLNTVQHC